LAPDDDLVLEPGGTWRGGVDRKICLQQRHRTAAAAAAGAEAAAAKSSIHTFHTYIQQLSSTYSRHHKAAILVYVAAVHAIRPKITYVCAGWPCRLQ
jgi:hypothetical protein